MSKLLTTQQRVKNILTACPAARCNDMFLYLKVVRQLEIEYDLDIANKPFHQVLPNLNIYGLPSIASVCRTRRKLQRQYPELKAVEQVQEQRAELEAEYKEYARAETE